MVYMIAKDFLTWCSRLVAVLITTAVVSSFLPASHTPPSPNEVLQKVWNKLASYPGMRYTYYRSVNYFSEGYHNEISGSTVLNFRSSDTLLGFTYQLETERYKMIYNGAEAFTLNRVDSTMKIYCKPRRSDFNSLSLFLNSIVTLRGALPRIIGDEGVEKALADTVINGQQQYLVSFALQNKTLSGLGGFDPVTLKRKFFYRIVVDRQSFLPLQVIQTNDVEPKDYVLTSFTGVSSAIDDLPENSWYFSTYSRQFRPAGEKKLALVQQGAPAPAWKLGLASGKDSIQLSDYRGSAVLLQFWIRNCGYCIAAVPTINGQLKKYEGKGLRVLGINAHDTREGIARFYERNRPGYPTVYDSTGSVTNAYGVEGFPTVVLVDEQGIVRYSGALELQQLEAALKKIGSRKNGGRL
jgi:peroxiredoxin